MSTMTREWRTDDEVAELRRRVEHLADTAGEYDYVQAQVRAFRATFGWIDGTVPTSPIKGEIVDEVDDRAVIREMNRGLDAERAAMMAREDGAYPGLVAMMLSWLRRETGTPAPV